MLPVAAADQLITYFQAVVIGLLQGVTELFPISSLGHSVILPQLLGWDIHQNDKYFITFLVATLPIGADGSFEADGLDPTALYRAVYVDPGTGIPFGFLPGVPVGIAAD